MVTIYGSVCEADSRARVARTSRMDFENTANITRLLAGKGRLHIFMIITAKQESQNHEGGVCEADSRARVARTSRMDFENTANKLDGLF